MIQPEEIGAKIKAIRKARHMTQEAVAELAYMTAQQVSRMETGTRWFPLSNYLAICEALCCTPNDIMAEESETEREETNAMLNRLVGRLDVLLDICHKINEAMA